MATDLIDVLRSALRSHEIDLHTALPVSVQSYDIATQKVSVQPMLKRVITDKTGAEHVESLPVIPAVPVAWPRAGGFFVHMPIQAGDTGLVTFCERSIAQWLFSGAESDPGDLEMHGFGGAVFHPGLHPDTAPIVEADAAKLVIGADNGGLQLRIGTTFVELGAMAGTLDFVAQAAKVLSDFNAVKARFNVYEAALATAIGALGSAPLTGTSLAGAMNTVLTANPYPTPASVAATKVKAE